MSSSTKRKNNTWHYLVALIGIICISILAGQLALNNLFTITKSNYYLFNKYKVNYRGFLLISQAIMASAIFIVAPLLYCFSIEKRPIRYFLAGEQRYIQFIMLTIGLTLSAMIVNTVFTYWNIHVKLPAYLKAFEIWAQKKEWELKKLTKLLTTFKSTQDLLLAIVIIAVIPAIGEELLFRGILQNLFFKSTKNIHIAILTSAFVFSAIHLQLYGFLPRFILGILFGYLYWWTKNLTFPIIAHFFNNSFTLTASFLYPKSTTVYELEGYQLPPISIIILFAIIGSFLCVYIQKKTRYLHT
jgi:membrane protease YdiL (CAAX protease family)